MGQERPFKHISTLLSRPNSFRNSCQQWQTDRNRNYSTKRRQNSRLYVSWAAASHADEVRPGVEKRREDAEGDLDTIFAEICCWKKRHYSLFWQQTSADNMHSFIHSSIHTWTSSISPRVKERKAFNKFPDKCMCKITPVFRTERCKS